MSDNSFPPPSFPAPEPAPAITDAMISVEPVAAPKPRRTGLLVGGAIAVAALVGGGVFALTRGDDSSSGGGGAAYSLTAAAQAAQEVQNVGYEMTISAGGFDISIDGRMDTTNQLMAMNMEMPMLGTPIEAVVDLENQVMYINAAAMGMGSDAPTAWVSADMTQMPNGGADALGAGTSNPLDISKAFEQADSVEEVGMETIDGEQLKHYKVTVSTEAALAADPSLQQQLDQLGGDFPDEIVYDVWVTEDNLLRLMKFELEAAGQTVAMEIKMTALGDIEPIVIPPADEVTDMTEMLAG